MFRRFFKLLFGESSGPGTLKNSELGKLLEDEELLSKDIVDFEAIPGNLEFNHNVEQTFTGDQLQFATLVMAVQQGASAFKDLGKVALRKPGRLHNARSGHLPNFGFVCFFISKLESKNKAMH